MAGGSNYPVTAARPSVHLSVAALTGVELELLDDSEAIGHSRVSRYWMPAGVGFVCQMMGIGLLGAYSFFIEPLSREFDVGVAVISAGPIFLLVAPALIAPLLGRFIDTHSIRSIMLFGVVLASVSLLVMAQMRSLLLLSVCFTAYAIGQVMYGPLVLNSLLVKVYQSGAARALAIAAMGVSLGSVTWPFVTAFFMDSFGWRVSLMVLSVCLLAVMGSVARLGLPRHIKVSEPVAPVHEKSDRRYLKSAPFWLIGVVAAIVFNIALTLGICYVPHFSQLGFSNAEVAVFIAVGGVGGFSGKMIVALFADRFRTHIRSFSLIPIAFMIAALTVLMVAESYPVCMVATLLAGVAGGAFIPLHPFINSAYFRAKIIGEVNGAQAPIMLPLGILCAPLAGYAFDSTGSYQPAIIGALILLVLSLVLVLALPRPSHNDSRR